MIKEMIICIIIIVLIFSLDIFSQKYTEKCVDTMTQMLVDLKSDMLAENRKELKNQIKKVDEKWRNMHDKLAYYIEHDELEKVDSAIVQMNSYIETKDLSHAIAELEEGKFVLEHIQDKTAFNLQNIF